MPHRSIDGLQAGWAGFLKQHLEARDDELPWLGLTLILGLIASCAFLVVIYKHPGSMQDDARQFLSWMGRWDDPSLLRNDLMADYWASVTPWGYKALFRVAWALGLEPLTFIKMLPALLFPLIAYFSFRFLRATGAEPLIACLVTGLILHLFVRSDGVISGTPRAFWPVLLLALLDGLARRRILQTAAAQLLMAGFYPQMALVSATVIGMTLLNPSHGIRLDLSRRRVLLVLLSALATIVGSVPFLLAAKEYGPTVTMAEALTIPTFGAGGRGHLVSADGSFNFVCGERLGFFRGNCARLDPEMLFTIFGGLIGSIVLFARACRAGETVRIRSELPLYLLIGSVVWFTLALLLLFRLHLPNRYSAAVGMLATLTIVPLLLEWLRKRRLVEWLMERKYGYVFASIGMVGVLVYLAEGAADIRQNFKKPSNPSLIAAIRDLPKDAVVGGFVTDLDFSPVLTGRSTLFSGELAVAYQLGYFNRIIERMQSMRDVVLTNDPAVLAKGLAKLGSDFILIAQETLDTGRIPERFRGFFGGELAPMEEAAMKSLPTLVGRLADGCRVGIYEGVSMLDAACLTTAAESRDYSNR
jgi:hypothetical protein